MDKENLDKINFLEKIIAKMPGLVYCKNIEGVYLSCNEAQAKIIGFNAASDIIGKTDYDFLNKEEATRLTNRDKMVMSGELIIDTAHPIEETIVLPDGKVGIFESVKIPFYDDNGTVLGLIGVSRDITGSKQAEIAKNDFISNMEHDLRTPFSGIGGIANLLHSAYYEKYPELKQLLDLMVRSCTQWENIHNRIFDALELQQNIKPESFYIQDELDKIQDMESATINLKGLYFKIITPTKEETGQIKTDNLKFNLILLSLISNAINFTETGGVTVRLSKDNSFFKIEVIDTGIGIPEDKFDYIFEKFTKLSLSNKHGENFKGIGLGLYISREDALKLKGKIAVLSSVGKGSTFTLILPIKLDDISNK